MAGEGGEALTFRLMGEQQLALVLRELLQRPAHRLLVLAGQQVLVRCSDVAGVVESVAVAPLSGVVSPHRRHQVARCADRVRLEHAVLDAVLVLQHPGQRLLHEILRVGVVRDASPDHPPQDRQQGVDVHAPCQWPSPDPVP